MFPNRLFRRLISLIVLLISAGFVDALTSDTIYVYDTIHVTDTVWVETPVTNDTTKLQPLEPISNATLLLDTANTKATLIYFSPEKSATIPINRICVNRNQLNRTKMKKAGY